MGAELGRALVDGRLSAASLPMLGMGRDVPDGQMRLRGKYLDVNGTTRTSAGVCNAYGEVFGHPGRYVLDGAAMPGPVGANPSLTIAALVDLAVDRLLRL